MTLPLCGQTLTLLPERAALWEEERALILADVHLGKAAAFLSHGLAVPEGGTAEDLARLSSLLRSTRAQRLIIVGDLFHAPAGLTSGICEMISAWRAEWPGFTVALVRGNHDTMAAKLPAEWRMDVHDPDLVMGPFRFIHDPAHHDGGNGFAISGHLHPSVRLSERRVSGSSAACFWLGTACLVLPAFGTFTGNKAIRPAPGDRLIACTAGRLIEVPAALHGV